MNKYLSISPEVQEALATGKPVVALESTIISHGMPYPQNVETALRVEQTIRENGAVPATIAIIGGRLKAGCTPEEIEYLGNAVDFAIKDEIVQGVAVWQFCDSRTWFRGGADIRMRPLGENKAGIFDIYRREKLAAKKVRELFTAP